MKMSCGDQLFLPWNDRENVLGRYILLNYTTEYIPKKKCTSHGHIIHVRRVLF